MRDRRIKEIIYLAIFTSIIFLLGVLPIGYILVPWGAAIALMIIPVIIGIIFLKRRSYALLLGFNFGLTSMITAFLKASNPADLLFRNPLVSILPRVLFALAAFETYSLLKKTKLNKKAIYFLTAMLSVIIHTTIVFIPFIIFAFLSKDIPNDGLVKLFGLAFIMNGSLEAVVAPFVVTPALIALDNFENPDEALEENNNDIIN